MQTNFSPWTTARVCEKERATAVRLTRFRGEMNDEDFLLLVKDVVRVFYKSHTNAFDHFPAPAGI